MTPFPRLRWVALGWLGLWAPAYVAAYGASNLLHLCDLAVVLTCLGLWRGNALLLSSQAVSSLVVDLVWTLDLLWRLLLGRHLIGGTEYMWNPQWALWLRLLSLFHVVWPPLLIFAVRRVGYRPRALWLQAGIALMALVAGRFVGPAANVNNSHFDPIAHLSWGPAAVHVAAMWLLLVAAVYLPTHLLLLRLLPARR